MTHQFEYREHLNTLIVQKNLYFVIGHLSQILCIDGHSTMNYKQECVCTCRFFLKMIENAVENAHVLNQTHSVLQALTRKSLNLWKVLSHKNNRPGTKFRP